MAQLPRNRDEDDVTPPDPEVVAKPKRRRYSADYKLQILKETDACTKPGEIGAILRREGLYSSLLATWRKQRDAGLKPKKRGRKAKDADPRDRKIKELEREKRRLLRDKNLLEARLKRADLMLDLQKKCAEILGVTLPPPPPSDESDS
jgi:transposase-like protein